MQRYRSGHNGADSKSVCAKSTRGFESLPLRQAKGSRTRFDCLLLCAVGRDRTLARKCVQGFAYAKHICVARSNTLKLVIHGTVRTNYTTSSIPLPLRQEKPKSNIMFGLGFLFCLFAVGVDGGLCREKLLT